MIKTRLSQGTVLVRFELPAAVSATSVAVCGDFNDWSPAAHPLTRIEGGHFLGDIELAAGRRWHFRYLLDGQRWENDWAADDYAANAHGGEDSVVDLTDTSALPTALTSPPSDPGPGPDIGHADSIDAVADPVPAPKLPRKRAAAATATKPKKAATTAASPTADSTTGTTKPQKATTKTRKATGKSQKATDKPEKKTKPQPDAAPAAAATPKPSKSTTAVTSTKKAKAADTPSTNP